MSRKLLSSGAWTPQVKFKNIHTAGNIRRPIQNFIGVKQPQYLPYSQYVLTSAVVFFELSRSCRVTLTVHTLIWCARV